MLGQTSPMPRVKGLKDMCTDIHGQKVRIERQAHNICIDGQAFIKTGTHKLDGQVFIKTGTPKIDGQATIRQAHKK